MRTSYYDALGLRPAQYDSAEIAQRFFARRSLLLAALDQPATHHTARRELDELHIAYLALRDKARQAAYLRECGEGEEDRIAHLRRLIDASLEDGLLRCSRRDRILAEGRRLGFSDFHTHLLIAQTQFGDMRALLADPADNSLRGAVPTGHAAGSDGRVAARLAAAAILALALLLAALRWLNV